MIVSACLLGIKTRYDGRHCLDSELVERIGEKRIVPVCPEQLGGLGTPREKAYLTGGDGFDVLDGKARVITASGHDVTDRFMAGAVEVVKIARLSGCRTAVLKEKSPSCGVETTTIDDRKSPGCGVLAALLERSGFEVKGRR